jgi:hypothetical protein
MQHHPLLLIARCGSERRDAEISERALGTEVKNEPRDLASANVEHTRSSCLALPERPRSQREKIDCTNSRFAEAKVQPYAS